MLMFSSQMSTRGSEFRGETLVSALSETGHHIVQGKKCPLSPENKILLHFQAIISTLVNNTTHKCALLQLCTADFNLKINFSVICDRSHDSSEMNNWHERRRCRRTSH